MGDMSEKYSFVSAHGETYEEDIRGAPPLSLALAVLRSC
jgi:hypothetical protein